MESLIKSRERVKDLGEVFTPDFLVEEVLDQFPQDMFKGKNKNWLEPTCGNGQFILGILKRKLKYHNILETLDTVFGCDVMPDNITECHIRIYKEIVLPYIEKKKYKDWQKLRLEIICIVENNIRLTNNALDEDFSLWQKFKHTNENYQKNIKNEINKVLKKIDLNISNDNNRLYYELLPLKIL